ncbi:MAG: hypothetical protein BGO51_20895 [Rhodospirillales bacterium 69-11]|nr:DUF3429 domain-containing protein [Rhodospirillales bacterium]MBN8909235.1 DUF3429 domain-containing protein [Rhodospirillales bacterium]MBN8925992.1 DUF3429 domain-containing protein [Rhodospirillales bacterium]OJW27847.1 MAG: hypothetical protein BGO51_20895 [Rhodospirillales bacterium 69-11]
MTRTPPFVVAAYGAAGLIPFLAPPLAPWLAPGWSGFAGQVLALYGALILSFLGGARWGFAVGAPRPSASTVSLAMLPSVVGLGVLVVPDRTVQLLGLAVALGLHWVWDVTSSELPAWYPRLRSVLTAGAVIGLLAGAAVLP